MSKLTPRQIFEQIFIPVIHDKFRKEVPSTSKVEALLKEQGGTLLLDHGATRSMTEDVHNMVARVGKSFGMIPISHYEFPEKKLVAHDLQFPDQKGFKWFSTRVKYQEFSPEAKKLVEEDIERAPNKWTEKGLSLLEKLEKDQSLSESEANEYVHEVAYNFLCRQGKPMTRAAYEAISKESSEAVNAMLIGPDYNHIAYNLHLLNIESWFGTDVIDILEAFLKFHGFSMLEEVQGAPAGVLRQTSTKADKMQFTLDNKGSNEVIQHPNKFLEFIQRGPVRDEFGQIVVEDGKIKRFQNFLSKNTVRLYDSTAVC